MIVFETHSQFCFTTLHPSREAAEAWIATEGQRYDRRARHFWSVRERRVG